jgi:hypothetical protein
VVIKFDVSSIPAGVTVTSAGLSFYCFQDDYPATGVLFDLFRLTRPWVETEVTWYNSDADSFWDNAGGDYYPVYIDQKQMDVDVTGTWQAFDVTTGIQKFVSEPDSNFGLLLSRGVGSDDLYFYTSESLHDSLRPKLTVSYTADTISITDRWDLPPAYPAGVLSIRQQNDGISFSVRLPEGEGFGLSVYDITGRKTWSYIGFSRHEDVVWLDAGGVPESGFYLVILSSGRLKIKKNFIIQP